MLLKKKRERGQLSRVGCDRHRIYGLLAQIFEALSSFWHFLAETARAAHSENRFYCCFRFLALRVDILAENVRTKQHILSFMLAVLQLFFTLL